MLSCIWLLCNQVSNPCIDYLKLLSTIFEILQFAMDRKFHANTYPPPDKTRAHIFYPSYFPYTAIPERAPLCIERSNWLECIPYVALDDAHP